MGKKSVSSQFSLDSISLEPYTILRLLHKPPVWMYLLDRNFKNVCKFDILDGYLLLFFFALLNFQVTFMLTDVLTSRRKRALNQADAQLYRDLARASGGQAVEVSKSDLVQATSVIEDSLQSAVVSEK